MVTRRQFVVGSVGLIGGKVFASPKIIDVLGNVIALDALPRRIVLLDATDMMTMAALEENSEDKVVGWASADRLDLGDKTEYFSKTIPEVGKLSPNTLSIEAIVALKPDLVVASAYMLPPNGSSAIVKKLLQFSIPVAWTSGYDNALPPEKLLRKSLSFWGAVLGREQRADQLIKLSLSHLKAVKNCIKGQKKPRVYMEIMTSFNDCCWAAGNAFWGDLFAVAGGDLIKGSNGWGGKLSKEGLIDANPEVFIATGSRFAPEMQPEIGPGFTDLEKTYRGLEKAAQRSALKNTAAVKDKRVHCIWSGLALSPMLTPVLAQCLAKWQHPEACKNIDPTATMAVINEFYAKPLDGHLWASLSESGKN